MEAGHPSAGVGKGRTNGPLVLLFRSAYNEINRRSFDGLYSTARGKGWNVQTVEYDSAAGMMSLSAGKAGCAIDVPELLKFWKPDGCIVELGVGQTRLKPDEFDRVPAVFLEWHPSMAPHGAACVYCDSEAIAACAARELLSLGVAHYGFVPFTIAPPKREKGAERTASDEIYWSRERRECFEKLVRMNGWPVECYPGKMSGEYAAKPDASLVRWVDRLPKPCGVFAANDAVARKVICACQTAGVAIPDDLSIVGVDDWLELCENTEPTLSSVRPNNESSGRIAAELLSEMMSKGLKRAKSRTFGVIGLTRRQSTMRRPGMDPRVLKALEHIRCHACERLAPSDVFAVMGCSRSLANLRFREEVGHTILDEIHAVRIEKVKELLTRSDRNVATIPDFCGYASLADLRRVFKQRVGCTLGEYRRSIGTESQK